MTARLAPVVLLRDPAAVAYWEQRLSQLPLPECLQELARLAEHPDPRLYDLARQAFDRLLRVRRAQLQPEAAGDQAKESPA